MLDRSGNAAGDVQVRRHHLAGLPDLQSVVAVARITRSAGCTDGRPEHRCQLLQRLETFGAFYPTPAGNDNFCLRQVYLSRRFPYDFLDDGAEVFELDLQRDHFGGPCRIRLADRDVVGTDRYEDFPVCKRAFLERLAGVDRANEDWSSLYCGHIGNQSIPEPGRNAGGQVPPHRCVPGDDRIGRSFPDDMCERLAVTVRRILGKLTVCNRVYFIGAVLGQFIGVSVCSGSDHDRRHFAAFSKRLRRRQGFK